MFGVLDSLGLGVSGLGFWGLRGVARCSRERDVQ